MPTCLPQVIAQWVPVIVTYQFTSILGTDCLPVSFNGEYHRNLICNTGINLK